MIKFFEIINIIAWALIGFVALFNFAYIPGSDPVYLLISIVCFGFITIRIDLFEVKKHRNIQNDI